MPLDKIQFQFTGQEIFLIKIDVEGHEIQVLQGASEIIKKHRPIIIAEVFEKNFPEFLSILNTEFEYSRYVKIENKEYLNEDYIFYP